MKVITDGTEQLVDLLANDTPLQLPTLFRHEVVPSSQSHQVDQTPTRSHQGNDEGVPASTTTPTANETEKNGTGYNLRQASNRGTPHRAKCKRMDERRKQTDKQDMSQNQTNQNEEKVLI